MRLGLLTFIRLYGKTFKKSMKTLKILNKMYNSPLKNNLNKITEKVEANEKPDLTHKFYGRY